MKQLSPKPNLAFIMGFAERSSSVSQIAEINSVASKISVVKDPAAEKSGHRTS